MTYLINGLRALRCLHWSDVSADPSEPSESSLLSSLGVTGRTTFTTLDLDGGTEVHPSPRRSRFVTSFNGIVEKEFPRDRETTTPLSAYGHDDAP